MTILGTVLLVAITAGSAETWRKIENDSFSFSLPASFKETRAHSFDSFVGAYVTATIKLSFDLGIYSNSFSDWPKNTKFENVTINGKAAKIGTVTREYTKGFPFSTQVHIKLAGRQALSMFATCKSTNEVALARKIFETIAFKEKVPAK